MFNSMDRANLDHFLSEDTEYFNAYFQNISSSFGSLFVESTQPQLSQIDPSKKQQTIDLVKISSKELNSIFVRDDPNESQKTNANFVHFLVKSFFDNLMEFKSLDDERYETAIRKLKRRIKRKGNQSNGLLSLKMLFGESCPPECKFQNRKIIAEILGEKDFHDVSIMENNHIKSLQNKKQYKLASKVFRLRCRSSNLSERIETR